MKILEQPNIMQKTLIAEIEKSLYDINTNATIQAESIHLLKADKFIVRNIESEIMKVR